MTPQELITSGITMCVICVLLAAAAAIWLAARNRHTPPTPTPLTPSYWAGGRHGYEPHTLEHITITPDPNMCGWPGQRLLTSHFSEHHIDTGRKGEILLAKAITSTGITGGSARLYSVCSPDKYGQPNTYGTDIDAIVITGDTIFLIDAKYYKSGHVTYRSDGDQLYCINNTTGQLVEKPRTMGKNMGWARHNIARLFPTMRVYAYICFIPTDKGEPSLDHVTWPGGVPAVPLSVLIEHIRQAALHAPYAGVGAARQAFIHLARFV